jgi:Fis family transcriptional regulator
MFPLTEHRAYLLAQPCLSQHATCDSNTLMIFLSCHSSGYCNRVFVFGFFAMNSKSPIFTAQSDVALRIHVDRAVRHYFAQLQGEQPSQVYDLVLAEMEKPLLSVVLEYTRGNQTRAAEILGLNRGTLRKKLKTHGLMSE